MPPARKFRVLDGMILIAATAIGLAASRPLWAIAERGRSPFDREYVLIQENLTCLVPIFLALTVAMLILQLLQPRPKLRRLSFRPGFSTAVAVISAMIVYILVDKTGQRLEFFMPADRVGPEELIRQLVWTATVGELLRVAGPTVAATWILLAIGGRWRRRRDSDWRELAGRILGGCWLALYLAVAIARWQS